jgi:hypothetical protein
MPQPQAAIRRVQQQGVQLAPVVVGQHQVQARDDRAGHELAEVALVEGQQLIDAARRALGQLVVGGQGGLHVEIEQQHAQPASAASPPRLAAVVVLPTPPFVEMMDTTCMALSGGMGSPRENGSGPVVEALGDPLVDFDRIPADGAHAQAQRLGNWRFFIRL